MLESWKRQENRRSRSYASEPEEAGKFSECLTILQHVEMGVERSQGVIGNQGDSLFGLEHLLDQVTKHLHDEMDSL